MAKTEKPVKDLNYEQAFSELEDIIVAMEGEQQPLEEAVKMFERGQLLAQHCSTLLDSAELRIKELNTDRPSIDHAE